MNWGYVNVCAAVCLLLIGGHFPQSSALHHRDLTINRQRRDAGENSLWGNPCDYAGESTTLLSPYELAQKMVKQAKLAYDRALEYKDVLSLLHSHDRFNDLLKTWEKEEWLRAFPWYKNAVLPKEKKLYSVVDPTLISVFLGDNFDQNMLAIQKGLKMVLAGLFAIETDGLNDDDVVIDDALKQDINTTLHDSRVVLCEMTALMKVHKITPWPLLDNEIPNLKTESKVLTQLLIYRDTLNYLEYIQQFFRQYNYEKVVNP